MTPTHLRSSLQGDGASAGPIVIKVGGTTLEDAAGSPMLWRAVADLHASHAGGVVLVHGGGKAVDGLLERLGMAVERREGIRLTPPEQVGVITGVLAGTINKTVVGRLCACGAGAVGVCLGDGGDIRAVKATGYGFDPGRVGEIVVGPGSGTPRLIPTLLERRFLPVVSSIAIDDAGELLNINADDAAAGLAGLLGASALLLMTDVAGIKGPDGALVRETTPPDIERMVRAGVITSGMIPKARAASAVVARFGVPVVILSGNDQTALAGWREGRAVGTTVARE